MQTNHLDVYKKVAEETGKDEQLLKDIGSFIFKETSQILKDPTCLIVKLKGIGSWHLRKKRMEIVVGEWTDRAKVRGREEFSSDDGYNTYLAKHIQYLNFQERLKEYEEYLRIRDEVRAERHKTQFIIPPVDKSDKFKSE